MVQQKQCIHSFSNNPLYTKHYRSTSSAFTKGLRDPFQYWNCYCITAGKKGLFNYTSDYLRLPWLPRRPDLCGSIYNSSELRQGYISCWEAHVVDMKRLDVWSNKRKWKEIFWSLSRRSTKAVHFGEGLNRTKQPHPADGSDRTSAIFPRPL